MRWRICPYQSSEISAFISACSLRICLFWSSRLTGVQSSEKEQIPSYWFQFFVATGPVTLICDKALSWIMDVDALSSGWTLGLAGRNLSKSGDFFCFPKAWICVDSKYWIPMGRLELARRSHWAPARHRTCTSELATFKMNLREIQAPEGMMKINLCISLEEPCLLKYPPTTQQVMPS